MSLLKTDKTKVKRLPARASYDRDLLNSIIDEAKCGHLAFSLDNQVHSIPMLFWRDEDYLFCHCSTVSRLKQLISIDVCISFAIVDGYVYAKSAFHHSMNYRSAVIYGQLEQIADDTPEKLSALKKLIDLFDESRWDKIRQPDRKELNATTILKLKLTEAVVKTRSGPPSDKTEDENLEVWAGVIPVLHQYGTPQTHEY